MRRRTRISDIAQLFDGFNSGYETVGKVMKDWDVAKVGREQVQETPAGQGMTGSLDEQDMPAQKFSFMGQTFDTKPDDQKVSEIRQNAIAGVLEKHGDTEGAGRIRSQIQQGKLTALNLKNAERADRAGAKDEEFQTKYTELAQGFRGNQIRAENEAAQKQYEEAFNQWKAAGDPNMPEPPKPTQRALSPVDSLQDMNALMNLKLQYGKASPQEVMAFNEQLSRYKKEGGMEALQALHAGDVKAAMEAFNKVGDERFDPNSKFELRKTVVDINGQKVPTHELVVTDPKTGMSSVINAGQGLYALEGAGTIAQQADRLYGKDRDAKAEKRADTQLGLAQAAAGRAATNDKETREDKEALRNAAADYQAALNSSDPAKIGQARVAYVRAGGSPSDATKRDDGTWDVKVLADGRVVQSNSKQQGFTVTDPRKKTTERMGDSQPAKDAATPAADRKVGTTQTITTGPHKGKTAKWDGKGWVLVN